MTSLLFNPYFEYQIYSWLVGLLIVGGKSFISLVFIVYSLCEVLVGYTSVCPSQNHHVSLITYFTSNCVLTNLDLSRLGSLPLFHKRRGTLRSRRDSDPIPPDPESWAVFPACFGNNIATGGSKCFGHCTCSGQLLG